MLASQLSSHVNSGNLVTVAGTILNMAPQDSHSLVNQSNTNLGRLQRDFVDVIEVPCHLTFGYGDYLDVPFKKQKSG